MHGVIAAGSRATAAAGAEILRRGGNAVDAAVAACFAMAAGEPALTSLAGGGVLLHRDAATGRVHYCDFFANAPGLGRDSSEPHDFCAVELDFGPARQCFHVGAGAAAVPGVIPGLCTALERWGRLTLGEVIGPACRFLREGVAIDAFQEATARLISPIWFRSDEGRRVIAPRGRLPRAGEKFRLPVLAEVLERLADGPWRENYREIVGGKILERFGPERGGLLTSEDLDAYQAVVRDPLQIQYRGATVYTNPPPAAGGELVALMLSLLERVDLPGTLHGSRDWTRFLCRAMETADRARRASPAGRLNEHARRWVGEFLAGVDRPLGTVAPVPGGPSSTTHVSVIDGAGSVAAVTASHGEGSGVFIEGSGIMMNNLMGEEDLFPGGFHRWPAGDRLATMMSPTLVLAQDGSMTVLGSGGANRIRTAILQVISGLVDYRLSVAEAVRLPRVHFEQGALSAETFAMAGGGGYLDDLGAHEVVRFDRPSLFFGGAHAGHRTADGQLSGAGDPRRGGVCLVV